MSIIAHPPATIKPTLALPAPTPIELAEVAGAEDHEFALMPDGDREYRDATEWPLWCDLEMVALADDSPADVEPTGPSFADQLAAADLLNQGDAGHALDEIDPATDGILASDWEFNRHLDDLADVRAADEAMSVGYAVL